MVIREPLHLPRLEAEWFFEATCLLSQWRDRAGFTPDFPVMPSWAPKAGVMVAQRVGVDSYSSAVLIDGTIGPVPSGRLLTIDRRPRRLLVHIGVDHRATER